MTKISIEKEETIVTTSNNPEIATRSVMYKFNDHDTGRNYFELFESEFAELKDQVNKI